MFLSIVCVFRRWRSQAKQRITSKIISISVSVGFVMNMFSACRPLPSGTTFSQPQTSVSLRRPPQISRTVRVSALHGGDDKRKKIKMSDYDSSNNETLLAVETRGCLHEPEGAEEERPQSQRKREETSSLAGW